MNLQLHDTMHRERAMRLHQEASASAQARRVRRARRLDRFARWADSGARMAHRASAWFAARARANLAR